MSDAPVEAVRPARPDDVAELADLYRRALAELSAERGGRLLASTSSLPEPLEQALADLVSAADHLVEVGTIDGAAVGLAIAHLRRGPDQPTIAEIDAIYVEPPARAIGVGEALLSAVKDWASGLGCAGIDAVALPGMRATKNFFETAGFTARLLVMHRPAGQGSG